jgi:hypothetical protein
MNRILLFLALMGAGQITYAQYVYTIKADSVKITNSCDTAELIIENHTQNVPGFLFNKGRGRTEFRRVLQNVNDNTFLIGADTLRLSNFWKQGGNSFGATGLLGTNDNYPLTFLQNGVEKGRLETSGNWLFNTTQDRGYLAQFNGNIWAAGSINVDGRIQIAIVPNSPGDNAISIGRDMNVSTPTSMSAIGIGQFCTVTASGLNAFGAGWRNYVIDGIGILGSTVKGIALGMESFAHPKSIAMGFESVSNGENQFVCGGPDHENGGFPYSNAIYNVYFGSGIQRNGIEGPGLSYTINGSGAFGTNRNGGAITIAGGKGTGSGTPGSIIFATAQSSSAGTDLQTLTEKARFDGNGNLGIGISTPSAMLHVSGTSRFDNTIATSGHKSAIRNASSDITIGDTDEFVFVNAAGSNVTITLPNATGRNGQTYTIKKTNEGNSVTITSNSSQLIDGMNSYSLISRYAFITVVASEGSWMIVSASKIQ